MHRRPTLLAVPVLAALFAAPAAPAQSPRTLAEVIRQEIAALCDTIGVSADGSAITDEHLAERVRVEDLNEHLLRVQKETVAELKSAQARVKAPEFAARVDEATSRRDAALEAVEQAIDRSLEEQRGTVREREERVTSLEEAVADARRNYDGAQKLQLQALERHGDLLEGGVDRMSQAVASVDALLEERTSTMQSVGMLGRLVGWSNETAVEEVESRLVTAYHAVEGAMNDVNGALADYGRDTIGGLPAIPRDPDDFDEWSDRIASARTRFDGAVKGLAADRDRLSKLDDRLESKKAELKDARSRLKQAKADLASAARRAVPPAKLLETLRERQDDLEALWAPYEEAHATAAAVQAIVAGVRTCIEAARASWGSTGSRAAHGEGTWRWIAAFPERGGPDADPNLQGEVRIEVTAINRGMPDDPADPYTEDDRPEFSVQLKTRDKRVFTGSGFGEPAGMKADGSPSEWQLLVTLDDLLGVDGHHIEMTGSIFGDPFLPGALSGSGRMRRLKTATGNVYLLGTGEWELR